MSGLTTGIGVKAAGSAVSAFFGKVPVWLRWTLLALLIAAAGLWWHRHAAHKAIAAAEKRGADAAYANVAKQASELASKADTLNRSLSAKIRSRTDEETRRIAADADALRLRGPGAARCAAVASLPRSASGHVEAAANADAAGPALPPDDFAAVPWGWLVNRSEEHDALLAEVKGWRSWHETFKREWDRWNAEAEKARTSPTATPAPPPGR